MPCIEMHMNSVHDDNRTVTNCDPLCCVASPAAGTTAMNGAPPTMLSPTAAMTAFPMPQANGQAIMDPNGMPQYPGMSLAP